MCGREAPLGSHNADLWPLKARHGEDQSGKSQTWQAKFATQDWFGLAGWLEERQDSHGGVWAADNVLVH